MQFGIMAMQIDELIPSGVQPEAVIDHVMNFEHAALIGKLSEAGFRLIELGGDLQLFLPQTFTPAAIEGLGRLKETRNLDFTIHLPLWSVEPSTPLLPVRKGSVQSLVATIKAVQPLDPERLVLHATGALAAEFYRMGLPDTASRLLLRLFQQNAIESLKAILAETGIPSRKIAIETIEFPFDLTLEMADQLDLSVCFDTGHVLAGFSGSLDFFEALERCLPRLGEVHLHDSAHFNPDQGIRYGVDHQPLGSGDLELGRFLDRLNRAGFDGPVFFELRLEQALRSLEVIRRVRPEYLPGAG